VNSGQPRSSDNFTFSAENIRENMRFKPRINYSARHQNNRHGYDQNITAGFRGPVSDYIEINADAGAFLSGASDQRSAIYQFGILHEPRESTTHSLIIQRSQVFPSAQLVTQLSYRLQQVLSPEPIRTMRLGARKISWKAGFRCGSRPGCVRLPGLQMDLYTVRFETVYEHTPRFESSLLYQFQERDSNRILDSYDENLVTYTLTMSF
jgi:hypothetical protein